MKETLRRALRTFLQAAAGYVAAHAALAASGVAKGDETRRGALLMMLTASVACGIAAVMNLPQRSCGKERDGCEEGGGADNSDAEGTDGE